MKTVTVHFVDGRVVTDDELADYNCYHCGCNIKDTAYGFIEDSYGNLFCEDEPICREALLSDLNLMTYDAEYKEEEE